MDFASSAHIGASTTKTNTYMSRIYTKGVNGKGVWVEQSLMTNVDSVDISMDRQYGDRY